MKLRTLFIVVLLISLALVAMADIPMVINYQGKITDPGGVAIDSPTSIRFRLYDAPIGGTLIWSELHPSVDISNGLFDVQLGSITSFPDTLTFRDPYWVEIQIESETLAPRQPLNSVPYAIRAAYVTGIETLNVIDSVRYIDSISFIDSIVYIDSIAYIDSIGFIGHVNVADSVSHRLTAGDGLSGTDYNGYATSIWEADVDNSSISINASGEIEVKSSGITNSHIADGTIRFYKLSPFGGTDGKILKIVSGSLQWADDSVGSSTADNDWAYSLGTGLSGDIYHNGAVSIGGYTPTAQLDVNGDADFSTTVDIHGTLHMNNQTIDEVYQANQYSGFWNLNNTGAGGVTIEADGNIALGNGSSSDDDRLYFDNAAEYLMWDESASEFDLSDDFSISGDLKFPVGLSTIDFPTEGMRISPNWGMSNSISIGNDSWSASVAILDLGVWGDALRSWGDFNMEENDIYKLDYLNFGTTKGSTGYGIRDNVGTMQFKNNGGSWQDFGSGGSTTSPGGSDSYVQYNNGGVFGGEAAFAWDDVNNELDLASPGRSGATINVQNSTSGNAVRILGDGSYDCEGRLNFGDGNYVYIEEPTDDDIKIHATDLILEIGYSTGTDGQVLTSDGTNAHWETISGGGTSYWNDAGSYLYPSGNSNARVYDSGNTYTFYASSSSGYGFYGITNSGTTDHAGVYGENSTTSSNTYGVHGVSGYAGVLGSGDDYALWGKGGGGYTPNYGAWLYGTTYGLKCSGDLSFWSSSNRIQIGSDYGVSGEVLTSNGSSGIYWGSGGGGSSPGGSDGYVQYNNGGSFGGESAFEWNDSEDELNIGSPGYEYSRVNIRNSSSDYTLRVEGPDGSYNYGGRLNFGDGYGLCYIEEDTDDDLKIHGGEVEINGTLTKSSGSFKIDHPGDPANKYLYHSFVESPDMMNIYNGNIRLDANGEAIVQLPEYFETLNKDYRYNLTPIGKAALVYVKEKVKNNRFIIAAYEGSEMANLEISWQVTGSRNDPWARSHRVIPEVDKFERNRGKYLHPELYGYGMDKSIQEDGELEALWVLPPMDPTVLKAQGKLDESKPTGIDEKTDSQYEIYFDQYGNQIPADWVDTLKAAGYPLLTAEQAQEKRLAGYLNDAREINKANKNSRPIEFDTELTDDGLTRYENRKTGEVFYRDEQGNFISDENYQKSYKNR